MKFDPTFKAIEAFENLGKTMKREFREKSFSRKAEFKAFELLRLKAFCAFKNLIKSFYESFSTTKAFSAVEKGFFTF